MYLFAKFNIPFFVFLVKLTKFINFIPKMHIPQNLRIRSEGTERHSALN